MVLLCHPAPTDQPTRSPYPERAPEHVRREHLAIDKVQVTEGVHDYFVLASEAEFRPSHRTCGHSRCYSHDLLFPVV